ncbi:MAG: hypothetical protein QOI78_4097 [Actinomycetota bacterium]|nr:hypothetical protein [Actinomycetota bacterium]
MLDAGREAERTRLREWIGAYRSAIELDIRDLEVVADGDAALRRGEDGWKIVHEHSSVPFDRATGEALTRLRPGSGTAAG